MRDVRIAYPDVLRQLLPLTAMQRARQCCEVSTGQSFPIMETQASITIHSASNIGTNDNAFTVDPSSRRDSGVFSAMHPETASSLSYAPVFRHLQLSLKGISDYVDRSDSNGTFLYYQPTDV